MRAWGAANRAPTDAAAREEYKKNIRHLNRHLVKANGNDMRFTGKLADRIESSLDELQATHPELYDKFMFTDGFREETVGYGASNSLHKSGAAFDFNANSYSPAEREIVYEIFARHGIACPLSVWNGIDEKMHMELAKSFYAG
jgi:hypothetical protein